MNEVDEWRAQCEPDALRLIDTLRDIVATSHPDVVETIKWNAPNFTLEGEDRITLGIERRGGVRAVLHRGAAIKKDDFAFDDPDALAKWPSADRGMLKFANVEEIEQRRGKLLNLFSRWFDATR